MIFIQEHVATGRRGVRKMQRITITLDDIAGFSAKKQSSGNAGVWSTRSIARLQHAVTRTDPKHSAT
jgi:hypothetical protein